MPLRVKAGTLRFVARTGFGKVTLPVLGDVVLPLPDGAEPGDCIQVVLLPGGDAYWRVVEKQGPLAEHKTPEGRYNRGCYCSHNAAFDEGLVGQACWPDLQEEWEKQQAMSDLEKLADYTDRWVK